MSRIELNIVATGNFRNVETSVARLRSQIDSLNASMMSIGFNSALSNSVSSFQNQFNNAIDSSGMFERHMVNLTTETTRFGRSLESGSARLGQLFKAASDYRRGELGQIRQLAREQVRLMNSTTMRMADGATQVIVPRGIDEGIEKQRILNQEYRIFRQVVANGSTEIINWGKNTQWAGRQLTVGLTVPLTIFGAAAGKAFMDADKQLTRLTKVYGDATKGMVNSSELAKIRSETLALSQEIARTMGVSVEETLGIAADIAATGVQGNELLAATSEAMRLSVLGEVDRQEAMKATLSIQSVFKKDTEGLTQSINLLNAVENQTSATINDLVTGIVKAGPVVQGLGGDVEDLAAMMVAMREGGVSASEAANAIKSSLASLINPTKQTTEVLSGFGIDIKSIVDKNAGDVIGTLMDLQSALAGLDDLSRQRSIEQIFGKFQFSRINALLANLGRAGSQTEQVFAIAGMSIEELAKNADAELKAVTESVTGKFQRAFESLKASLIPIGETFVTIGTILLNVGNKILEIFNAIPDPIKNIINGLLGFTAVLGPIIMITGVLGNFFGYLVKGISTLMAFKKEGRGAFDLLTLDSIAARDASELLSESLYDQGTAMNTMAQAVDTLVKKLQELVNQLNHTKSASGGLDQVSQGVLANAEAAAIVRMGPGTPYTTPEIPWTKEQGRQRYKGRAEAGVTYSHLTPESMLGGRGVLGLGTFVDQAGSDVQKDLKNFYQDLVSLREESITPEIRRQALEDLSRGYHGTGPALEASLAQIRALTDEQLAQILPTWEKLTTQSTEYFAILSVAAEKAEAGNQEVAAAFKKYSQDIESGRDPIASLSELRSAIDGTDQAVDKKVKEIAAEFDKIEQELLAMPAGRERAVRTAELVKDRIITPYEIDPTQTLSAAGIKGMGEGGLRNPLLHAIQMYTDRMFNDAQISQEMSAALATGNKKLVDALLRLAEARQREAMASEENVAAEEQYQLAAKNQAEAQAAYAKAQKESAQALLRYGPNSPQYKAAKQAEYQAQQKLIQSDIQLVAASERKKTAILQSNRASQELSEEEIQLAALRERQSLEVTENIVSTQRNSDSTNKGTVAREGQTAAISSNKGGMLAGGKLGGAISLASMAAMFLPRPGEDTGAGQAMNAGINIANMAGMGAMFGPKGLAIGAAIGVAVEGISFFGRRSEEAAAELAKLKAGIEASKTGLTELEKEFFNVEPLKQLEDLPLNAFNLRTQEATNKLREFANAVANAEPGSVEAGRRDQIASMESAEQFINDPMFSKMVSEALLGGMDIKSIKTMIGGYLSATGKEIFAPIVNAELDRIGKLGTKPEEIGAKYLAQLQDIADRVIRGADYTEKEADRLRKAQQLYEESRGGKEVLAVNPQTGESEQANLADTAVYLNSIAEQFGMTLEELLGLIQERITNPEAESNPAVDAAMKGLSVDGQQYGPEFNQFILDILPALKEVVAISPDLYEIEDVMGAVGNEASMMAQGIFAAMASGGQTFDQFLTSLGASANALDSNKQLIGEIQTQINEMSPDAGRAFSMMMESGVQLQDALRIVSMVIADVNTDWAALADMARTNPANFRANVWTSFIQGSPVGTTPTAQAATNPEDAIQSALGAIDYSGDAGGGSGGSGSDYYDKLIEAQDKIIEGIQKEREERQKLLELQEKQVDFALRRQDLENQIARATAEGNFAEAALLQAQLNAEKEKYQAEEIERRRQEREDKKIAAAEKEKERLQKLQDASSGGGGGGGSTGPSAAQQKWTANRVEVLTSGVVNWTEGAELRVRTSQMGPWTAFFDSDRVKSYRQELEKLNIPAENIDQILNELYDSWIDNNNQLFAQTDDYKFIEDSLKKMGVAGEDLKEVMPDVFGALLDKELNPKEKIDVIAGALYDLGYETDEAYRKAKKLYDQYGEDFDGKGIDDEIARWVEWNDIILKAQDRLRKINKQLSEGATISDLGLSADRLEEVARTAAGQSTAQTGPTFNAGGVKLTGENIGSDLMLGVEKGLTDGVQATEAATRQAIKWLEIWMRDETKTNSPSEVYKLLGKDMIAGLINGLVIPPDTATGVITTITDTFKSAVDSYKILFTDPTNGISGVIDAEVKTAADNFYNTMTTRMQETVDEINNILKTNLTNYTFQITGNPKIYDGGARSLWQRVFDGIPDGMFTSTMPQYATGGYVSGPGGPTEDKIPALLSDGEYVIKASSVSQYGTELLDQINARKFYTGGYVSADRAETAASGNKYLGGYKPKPQYSGGTPTYTSGYSNSNTQATRQSGGSGVMKGLYNKALRNASIMSMTRQPFYSPGIGEEVGGIWQILRNIAASTTDLLLGGFVPPFMRSERSGDSFLDRINWNRTSIGSLIGGDDYLNTSGSELLASMLDFAPGGGKGSSRASAFIPVGVKAGATGTRASRDIVAKDYEDMLGMSRQDFEDYVETAWPSITPAEKADLIGKIFDENGNVRKLDVINAPPYSSSMGGNPGARMHQHGLSVLDILRDTNQAKRFKSIYDELSASGSPAVGDMTFDEFMSKVRNSSISAQDTSTSADKATALLDHDFIRSVNSVYARQNYGLSDTDLIRLYRGLTRSEQSNVHGVFRGYSTTDPNVAKSFSRWAGRGIWATDISVGDLPQILGTTGWADEFAQFIPESAWAEVVTEHGVNTKISPDRPYRAFDPENVLMPRRIKHDDFVNNHDSIVRYAKSIGLSPTRLLSGSGFRRVGPYWQLDLSKIDSMSSENKQLLKYLQDSLGMDLVSLKTGEGLAPFKFADGGLVRVGKENLTVLGEGISDYARRFVGTPYSSGAAWADGPANGWGCATATKWLYDSYAGVDPGHPSLSASQYSSGAGSRVNNMLPGDLLFFYYPNGVNTSNPINHVGMALGNGSMFHARSEALGTQITGIDGAGMDRARQRAGGSAIKRYLPETIAGMGLPTAKFKMGGKVYGKGGPTSDDILALISNGEYVMNANAVSHYGKDFMDAVNKGILPEAAMGGMFSSKYPGYVQRMGDGGMLSRKFGIDNDSSSISNVEYNINVNVAGTNSSPDDIAEAVMKSLKRKERMVGAVTRV
jgi:TP901 family phage tail tape measure protein